MRLTFLFIGSLAGIAALAQTKPEPDVLIFVDGEKLMGHFVRSNGEKVTFKSDMAGEVTVEWSKVKELHSSQKFAVIGKDVELRRHPDTSQIPKGTVSVADQKIEVNPGGGGSPKIIPVAGTAQVIDEPAFEKAVGKAGFLADWKGSLTGGVSLVEATQKSQTFTGGFNFIRAIPGEDWLALRNRTIVDFSAAYGKVTQPGTPQVKTDIYHAHAERDEYFSPRVFGFGQMAFDHNFSQGLDLQQTYGGGIGWTVLRNDGQELDLKASMNYIRQSFAGSAQNQSLIGTTFGENYNRKLTHGILFVQQLAFTPAWNNTSAYSGIGSATLTVPVYKRLNFGAGVVDSFLNDPPSGFKKNSFQFTTAVTYTLP